MTLVITCAIIITITPSLLEHLGIGCLLLLLPGSDLLQHSVKLPQDPLVVGFKLFSLLQVRLCRINVIAEVVGLSSAKIGLGVGAIKFDGLVKQGQNVNSRGILEKKKMKEERIDNIIIIKFLKLLFRYSPYSTF